MSKTENVFVDGMERFTTNDHISIAYRDAGLKGGEPLIMIHGFTGSSEVWKRNIPFLSQTYRIIAPDLRGHGKSNKSASGYHVSRLAMDLKNLIDHLELPHGQIRCIGASLGCAILWSFSELFTPAAFSHMIWVDQSPLQNYTFDGSWTSTHGNRGCNSPEALARLQTVLEYRPEDVYNGNTTTCLAYMSHPRASDNVDAAARLEDAKFFRDIALQGNATWFGKLMADHTSLDWRDSIRESFGRGGTGVLVVASERSGCFPSAGPLSVVESINSHESGLTRGWESVRWAAGVCIDWGGHWCYYENADKFNRLVADFLST